MLQLTQALDLLSRGKRCVLVTVALVKGSAPRESGAKMLVWESDTAGSVGGGHLEFQAIAFAHRMLAAGDGSPPILESFSLGPDLNHVAAAGKPAFEALMIRAALAARVERLPVGTGCALLRHRQGDATRTVRASRRSGRLFPSSRGTSSLFAGPTRFTCINAADSTPTSSSPPRALRSCASAQACRKACPCLRAVAVSRHLIDSRAVPSAGCYAAGGQDQLRLDARECRARRPVRSISS
jgi:xanthine/CO dehydrogenase XdhC/CoxF family maturation factor